MFMKQSLKIFNDSVKGEIITPNGNDAWFDLPGLAVLIGGMWVANLYYWGLINI